MEDSLGEAYNPDIWEVIQSHDDLTESWDPYGEHAWGQADHDREHGKTGEWYVICKPYAFGDTRVDLEGETCSFASYEVELV